MVSSPTRKSFWPGRSRPSEVGTKDNTDTNVLIASLTDEPDRGNVATEFLNREHEYAMLSATRWNGGRC